MAVNEKVDNDNDNKWSLVVQKCQYNTINKANEVNQHDIKRMRGFEIPTVRG